MVFQNNSFFYQNNEKISKLDFLSIKSLFDQRQCIYFSITVTLKHVANQNDES